MPLKVIGAGFGRTGTLSLKVALEQLGFTKCYHMTEVFAKPDHVKLWDAAARGEPVDWEALFRGYQATVDWPGCNFYQEYIRLYPEAKVILTLRDPDRWYDSARQTIYQQQQAFPAWILPFLPQLALLLTPDQTADLGGSLPGPVRAPNPRHRGVQPAQRGGQEGRPE